MFILALAYNKTNFTRGTRGCQKCGARSNCYICYYR